MDFLVRMGTKSMIKMSSAKIKYCVLNQANVKGFAKIRTTLKASRLLKR